MFAKFGDHWSYGNGDVNSYISSNIDTFEKAELTASVCYNEIFSKSVSPTYNFEVPGMTGRNARRRRRTQAIAIKQISKQNKYFL